MINQDNPNKKEENKTIENKTAAASPNVPKTKENDLAPSEWDKNIIQTEGNLDVADSSFNMKEGQAIAKQISEAKKYNKFSN